MDNLEKDIDLSLDELKRTQRRLEKIITRKENALSFLERASDNCWENPNADEKYEYYLNKMGVVEESIDKLTEMKENLEKIIIQLKSLK